MELLAKWQPMDVEDALELLGSKYKDYPKIRSYAVSRLQLASDNVKYKFLFSQFSYS
jgi:phosphatidylinositol 3-kinase